jgi:hypothetical protein
MRRLPFADTVQEHKPSITVNPSAFYLSIWDGQLLNRDAKVQASEDPSPTHPSGLGSGTKNRRRW